MVPVIEIILPAYAVMATIGALVSLLFLYYRKEAFSIHFKQMLCYMLICGIFMILCSKLVFAVAMMPSDLSRFLHYFMNGGIVFYGGMYGILLGIVLTARCRHDDIINIFNFAVPAIPLFHSFGRIGCLFGGCCYGVEWKWGVRMLETPDIVRFPVQIVESLCNIIIFISLLASEKKKKDRCILPVYLGEYSLCRFVLEFFRGDTIRGIWWGFSTSQVIAVITLSVIFFWKVRVYNMMAGLNSE